MVPMEALLSHLHSGVGRRRERTVHLVMKISATARTTPSTITDNETSSTLRRPPQPTARFWCGCSAWGTSEALRGSRTGSWRAAPFSARTIGRGRIMGGMRPGGSMGRPSAEPGGAGGPNRAPLRSIVMVMAADGSGSAGAYSECGVPTLRS